MRQPDDLDGRACARRAGASEGMEAGHVLGEGSACQPDDLDGRACARRAAASEGMEQRVCACVWGAG
eukprot:366358-Chlamydomonas_euryale.AAC.6